MLATERFEDRALLAWLCAVVAVLSLLPLARLVVEGFAPGGTLSTSALTRVLASSTTWLATGHSLVTAFGGTLVALLIGGVVALVLALTDVRARNAFVFCFVMPLLIAPQVVALASPVVSGHVTGQVVTVAGGMEGRVVHE